MSIDNVEFNLDPTMAQFKAILGEGLIVTHNRVESTLIVERVSPILNTESNNSQPFSVLLRGPLSTQIPQSIIELSHTTLGKHELFIVPIGKDAQGIRYEILIN